MAKDHTSNPSPTLDCCGAVADPCRVNNFPDSHERPNDDVQFGSGEEPDWDRFLESHFHLWLAGGRDGEPPTPLIKTNPRINDGEPYIVLTSGAPDPAGNSGELLQRHITGRQALSLAPPGVSLLVDDHSLRAKSDEIAYLRSELERIGPDNLVLDDLMFTFGFTAEDLEANRAGTISTGQRNRLLARQQEADATILVYLFIAFFLAVMTFGFLGAWLAGILGAAVFALLLGHWWYHRHYPLGENRVKLLIAETRQSHHATKSQTLSRVGMGLGGRWLPHAIPEGMLVRIYWNATSGNETLVHSIEPARVGDRPNIRWRNAGGLVLLVLTTLALYGFVRFSG